MSAREWLTAGELLGYPQVVLALWCPLVSTALWRVSAPLRARLAPRERFAAALAALLAPALAIFVPYAPGSLLRDALPWRAPLAWGVTNDPDLATSQLLGGPASIALALVWLLPVASLLVSALVAAGQLGAGWRRWRALVATRIDDLDVVEMDGFTACTRGLLRPRVLIARAVLESPHAAAVIAHERCHARGRHTLWLALATTASRAWWWMPGRDALLQDLRESAELWADDAARDACGAPAVAGALLAALPAAPAHRPAATVPVMAFSSSAALLRRRAEALLTPAGRSSPGTRAAALAVTALGALGLVVLL